MPIAHTLTALLAQHARCNGVNHRLSLVLTRAPFNSSSSAISASPQNAAACRALRFSQSYTATVQQVASFKTKEYFPNQLQYNQYIS